jgi:8-oxo-dGTP pyrophosphatase MutT (NUDIX family)
MGLSLSIKKGMFENTYTGLLRGTQMAVYHDKEGSVVLLVDAHHRIAMQLRDNKPGLPAANKWGLFGGLINTPETPKETAIREIQEELSIILDSDRLSLYRKHYIPEQHLTSWIFHYPVESGELDNAILQEGQMWDFISKDDPRVSEIGLHHHEIVLDYWVEQTDSSD